MLLKNVSLFYRDFTITKVGCFSRQSSFLRELEFLDFRADFGVFSDSDTLHRHEVSHHAHGPDGERERVYRINVSTFRACVKCAIARVRCSGGTPCDRCGTKKLDCEYPKERKSKIRAMREASQASAAAAEERQETNRTFASTNETQSQNNDVRMETVSPVYTAPQQPRFGSFEHSSISPVGGPQGNFINQGIPQTSNCTMSATTTQHDLEPSTNSPIRDQNYPDIGTQQFYATPPGHNLSVPLHIRSDSSSDKYGYPSENSPSGINTSMDMALPNPTSNPIQMNFDPNLFDQSVLSAINWLPTDVFDSASDDLGFIPGASNASLLDTWSADSHLRSSWVPPIAHIEPIPSSRSPGGMVPDARNLLSAHIRDNMGEYARAYSEGSSQAGSIEGTVSSGEYYIDGDGARLPKYKRRCKTFTRSSQERIPQLAHLQSDRQTLSFGFPNVNHVQTEGRLDEPHSRKEIHGPTYEKILDSFYQSCQRSDISLFPRFDSEFFPPIGMLTEFIYLYFDSFQPVYPIFHAPTFDPNKCHWVLTLAIAAVGCQYAEFDESEQCAMAMHEFLRRAIFVEVWVFICVLLISQSTRD